jgi:hypothetical protein
MPRHYGKSKANPRPHGEVRRSQIVTTFGPGSMMDLINHAVIISGLDFWKNNSKHGDVYITEPRLRDRIVKLGLSLAPDKAFKEPPLCEDGEATEDAGIQVLEFPSWFVCQNPNCRALVKSNTLEVKRGRYYHQCSRSVSSECVPIRFVAACKKGHLQEFPWIAFVHGYKKPCPAPRLTFEEGVSGDFSEIYVKCACGDQRAMSSALAKDANPTCKGKRPWLGRDSDEECNEKLRLLVRTASNSYFSQVVSALSIPSKGRELHEAVQRVWDVLQAATPETLEAFKQVPKVEAGIGKYPDEQVLDAVEGIRNEEPADQGPLRSAEYEQLVSAEPEQPGELPDPEETYFARTHEPEQNIDKVAQIVLLSKLREVRVQVGFTRLEPATPDLQGEYDLGVESASLALASDWLPATEVLGEGVFIRFDEQAVSEWERRPAVQERAKELLAGYEQAVEGDDKAPPFLGVRYYMLHSLSHLLISAIALECGYAASAIRERIYCRAGESDYPMAGIMLHTGSYGSEGTLGGLVDQGRRLAGHLERAFDLGSLCSNDPVCAAHSPRNDPAQRHLEGAACHGCLFIAECSCERFNRFLDRALVVPTMGHDPKLAFFGKRP